MGRARGQNAIMGLAFETTYGTPPVSGYTKLPFVSSQLGAVQPLIESDLLGQGRVPFDPIYDIVTNDGDVAVPLDARAIGTWMKMLFGSPVTTAVSGGYSHVFTSGMPTLPSASIEIGMPDRPAYSTHYGVCANTLQVNMQRSGLTTATIGLIGKGETVPSLTSNAGSLSSPGAIDRFAAARGAVVIDEQLAGEVTQANFSFSNGLDKDETIRPDSEINGIDAGMPSASLSLTTKFADLVLYNKATSGVPARITLQWSLGNQGISITMPRLFLPRVKRPITGPGGIMAEFNAVASSAGGPLVEIVLSNDIASYA